MGFFVQLLIAVVIAIVTAPKPTVPKPASLTDLDMPTAEPGRNLPVIFGTVLMKDPNVVWYGDFELTAILDNSGKG